MDRKLYNAALYVMGWAVASREDEDEEANTEVEYGDYKKDKKEKVTVKDIPDFCFNLEKIGVPFSHTIAFDQQLSKFNYAADE